MCKVLNTILWGPESWGTQEMLTGSGPKSERKKMTQIAQINEAAAAIEEQKKRKAKARMPIETVYGGSQVPNLTQGNELGF